MRTGLFGLLLVWTIRAAAQADSAAVPDSRNGWYLSPHGTIRVLVLFAEITYDKHPEKDPQPEAARPWPKGQLPIWKDELFDAFPSALPQGVVTRYYHDISLGRYTVLGDYVDRLIEIKESEQRNLNDWSAAAWTTANASGELHTAHDLGITDFDRWRDGGQPGLPKVEGPDDPHSYDHVMVILRNSGLTHGQGSTDGGSAGKLFGYPSDTQSRFGAMNGLPFEILKHEFNHLLLGSNNFHSGGGNAAQFESYTLGLQGGWSMMGAAGSSLLTCTGWDRDRLDWRADGAVFPISARNVDGASIQGDIHPLDGDTGLFVLRDFVTTGDALRLRMPFIPANEYRQWLWIENHQTYARNGSPTDRFHWEHTDNPCVQKAVPGLYMAIQIERDTKRGKDVFGGNADYLHALTACGHYDLATTNDTLRGTCPFMGQTVTFRRIRENPLAGNCEQETVVYDRNADGKLERSEHFVPTALAGEASTSPRFFGRPDHAFTADGHRVLDMASNPSSANMLTLTAGGKRERNKGGPPDNRTVHLNGLRVELVEQRADGSILVRVSAGDTRISNDVIWSADSIVLPPLRGREGASLIMSRGKRMLIDRSLTPTRLVDQGLVDGRRYFAPPTRFMISSGASMRFERDSELALATGSELHLMPGAVLVLDRSTKVDVDATSRIIVHGDASITAKAKVLKKLRKKGRLVTEGAR